MDRIELKAAITVTLTTHQISMRTTGAGAG